jgi:hypothetical protein
MLASQPAFVPIETTIETTHLSNSDSITCFALFKFFLKKTSCPFPKIRAGYDLQSRILSGNCGIKPSKSPRANE